MVEVEESIKEIEFYKLMLTNIQEGFVYAKMVYDINGNATDWIYEFVNDAYEVQTGNKPEDVLNRKASDVYKVKSETFLTWVERFDKAIKNSSRDIYEDYFSPSKKWLRASVFSPKEGYFAATFTDVSEKRNFKALSNQKNRFQLLFNSINTGVIFQNVEGEIIDCNPAAQKILGLDYNNLTKMTSANPNWKAIREDGSDLPAEEHPPMKALKAKQDQNNQIMGVFNPEIKTHAWLRVNSVPIFSNKELIGVVSSFDDITEKRNSRKRLEKLNEKLIESNKNLEEFAYVASHDLKEPVRTVKSFTKILEKNLNGSLNEKDQKIFDFILKGSQKMEYMIEELLRYSRLNTQPIDFKIFDLSDAIRTAKSSLTVLLKEKKIDFEIPKTAKIKGNKLMITRVFQNIIDNAIKYNKSEKPTIKINTEIKGNTIRVSFIDNGIGIDSEYFDTIFGLFKRLHSESRYEGSGFGLSICKKIIEKHHGNISVNSELEKGTTFHVDLPIA